MTNIHTTAYTLFSKDFKYLVDRWDTIAIEIRRSYPTFQKAQGAAWKALPTGVKRSYRSKAREERQAFARPAPASHSDSNIGASSSSSTINFEAKEHSYRDQ